MIRVTLSTIRINFCWTFFMEKAKHSKQWQVDLIEAYFSVSLFLLWSICTVSFAKWVDD